MAPVSGSAGRGETARRELAPFLKAGGDIQGGALRNGPPPRPPAAEPGSQEVTAQGAPRPCFLWAPKETQEGPTSTPTRWPLLLLLLLRGKSPGSRPQGEEGERF